MNHTLVKEWFTRYQHDIYHFLVYYLGRTDVEDLVQEVFLTCLKQQDLKVVEHPKTWLLTVARNKALNIRRKQMLFSWLPETVMERLPSPVKGPEQKIDLNEEIEEVYSFVQRLKKSYRDVIILRLIQDLTVEKTSDVLQWSPEKVSVTYHRAMKKLQSLIKEEYEKRKGIEGSEHEYAASK